MNTWGIVLIAVASSLWGYYWCYRYDKRNTVYCNDCKYNENGYCTMWFSKIEDTGFCYKGEKK